MDWNTARTITAPSARRRGVTVFLIVWQLRGGAVFPASHRIPCHSETWVDRAGAFWLVSCAFGPFFGWIVTSVGALSSVILVLVTLHV